MDKNEFITNKNYKGLIMSGGSKKGHTNYDKKEGIDVLERKKAKTKHPKRYRVIIHNDEYTTQQFVVHVLTYFFRKNPTEASQIMLKAHVTGKAIVGVYTKDIAETKVALVTEYARTHQHPLVLTTELDH